MEYTEDNTKKLRVIEVLFANMERQDLKRKYKAMRFVTT